MGKRSPALTVPGLGRLHVPAWLLAHLRHAAPVQSVTVVAAFVAVAVLATAAAVFARRRGRLLSAATVLVAVVTAVVATAAGVNAEVGYVSTWPQVAALAHLPAPSTVDQLPAAGGRMLAWRLPAPQLGMQRGLTYVYLPPGYTAARRYPVVYLLHGWPGTPVDWFRAGEAQLAEAALIRHHLAHPMILVAPQASPSFWADTECLNLPHARMEDYLLHVVVPAVDHRLSTLPGRSGRAIGGGSAGAYCALNLGLRHSAVFSAIAAVMPYDEPGSKARFAPLLGGEAGWRANSPELLARGPLAGSVATFLDAGEGDAGGKAVAFRLAGTLRARHLPTWVRLEPGLGHTWVTARAAIPWALEYLSLHLAPPQPSAPAPSPTTWRRGLRTAAVAGTGGA